MDIDNVYREHAQAVYLYVLSLCHDPHLAQDLTEDTFLRAMRTLSSWKGDCALLTWLCTIARNQYLSHCRKKKRRPEEMLPDELSASGDASPEQSLLREESYLALMRRIHALEPDAREVVYLRVMGEMTFRQIGQVMNRTENWARVTFYRAKERLRKEMERHE